MKKLQLPSKKTKIVCTIGPASQKQETLEQMIANGMNVARINFAHGSFDSHRETIATVRAAAAAVGAHVAIMGDLPGPKIRLGELEPDVVHLERGQSYTLVTEEIVGGADRAHVSFDRLPQAVQAGDRIFLNDGFIQLLVRDTNAHEVHTEVLVGGELRSAKGVNLPGIDLGISAFTDFDRECLEFAAAEGLDAVSQSFVQDAADIAAVREAATDLDYEPFLIAKIERARAVDNIEAILEVVDGIMVARGDLGVEIPIEEIAVIQKQIIHAANRLGRPVITATHMLESMTDNPRPTRAEATDVANAIIDGTDSVMLSGETAVGHYPEETVAVMARIASVTEPEVNHRLEDERETVNTQNAPTRADGIISFATFMSAELYEPVAVFVPTLSGRTARMITRFRLHQWVVAVSPNPQTCQELLFSYGVYPVLEGERPADWEKYARDWLKKHGVTGEIALLTQGSGTGRSGSTNKLGVIELNEPLGTTTVW